ncbi:MAG: aspartate ammonia-lyase [Bacteroidota bacterium]
MDPITLKDFLKKIDLFRGLNEDEINVTAEKISTLELNAGDFLFRENTAREGIYFVYEGEIELFKTSVYGIEKNLAVFTKLDFLGEGSLTDDSPHSTSARASNNSIVLCISARFFAEHGEISIKVFSNIVRVVSRRMRHANAIAVNSAVQYESGRTRREHDLLGDKDVPHEYYYGVQTLRALENFNISGITLNFFPVLIDAFAMVKMAAARANHELGLLPEDIKNAIETACQEILHGKLYSHFVVDMIQGGAGTSTNMNANEVIANRAIELLGHEKGEYQYCHPNDHVNMSQSTNDAYPTAVMIALFNANTRMVPVLEELIRSFRKKAAEFSDVIKMGRTQLQDAVPMTLGQEFNAWATTLDDEVERLNENAKLFLEVNMGATAIGTGICADQEYSPAVMRHLREITGLDLHIAPDLIEATSDTGAYVMYSSAVKRLSVKLSKVCNDLRLLASGPRTGLQEINLPAMQPGSSIMPGKVNPVIPEVVNQIAFKVIGNDLTVTLAAEAGQLQLNVMEPVIVQSIFESIEMLKNGMTTLQFRCIDGITANKDYCRAMVHKSIGLVTALNPVIGYKASSAVAKEAFETGRGVYELVLEKGLLTKDELDEILKPENMIRPHKLKPRE